MLTNNDRKGLQMLLTDSKWAIVERALQTYITMHFVQTSVKRETEFDTIWYAAYNEGGKEYLTKFFQQLELEASSYEEK